MAEQKERLQDRKAVPEELTWDLSRIYATEEEMYRDAEKMEQMARRIADTYRGRLDTPQAIDACLTEYRKVCELMILTGNYCGLAVEVDYYDSHNQERNGRIGRRLSEIGSLLSFVDSEIMDQEESLIREAIAFRNGNSGYLESLLRSKAHLLHPEAERVLAALSQSLGAPYEIYNAAKLADMKFEDFEADGEKFPLGYSLFEDN